MHRYPTAALIIVCLALQACISVPPRNAVPEELIDQIEIPGGSLARIWGDVMPADSDERIAVFMAQLESSGMTTSDEPIALLTISGGGADGAFGAGLLKGWSESGLRPELLIVTGISTGALSAPFAFLGSDYDDELERVYTSIATSDLIERRGLLSGLMSDALADTGPLQDLLGEEVDDEMIDAIARQHNTGRRLLIGTTNLDAQRPVIWNIGAIANVDTEEANQLIRDVMLASASIPGAFPPVRIKVRIGDEEYDELHVDGGVSSQVFLYPAQMNLEDVAEEMGLASRLRSVYVIRNGFIYPQWSEVKPKLAPVLLASAATMIRTQGLGDLYRIYLGTVRDHLDFKLAYIPRDFDVESEEEFDPKYMKALFDLAYELARDGYAWESSPPGIALPQH